MSIRAGSIVTVAGRNVVDRLQTAGLGDANVPIETIYEIGNDLAVDKIPGEAGLHLQHGELGRVHRPDGLPSRRRSARSPPTIRPARRPGGHGVPLGGLPVRQHHVAVEAQHGQPGRQHRRRSPHPGYYPTRLELPLRRHGLGRPGGRAGGGSFYYARRAGRGVAAGDGVQVAFVTSEAARAYRLGGAAGTTFKYVFGVLVNGSSRPRAWTTPSKAGRLPWASASPRSPSTPPPAAGAQVRFMYFSEVAKAYPQAVNADTIIKPGAVRGRNIDILVGERGVNQVKLPGVQTFELTATVNSRGGARDGQRRADRPLRQRHGHHGHRHVPPA
jgi:hypothetical protein